MSESDIERAKKNIDRAITYNTQAAHEGSLGLSGLRTLHESYTRGYGHLQKTIQHWGYEMVWAGAQYDYDVLTLADHFSKAKDCTENALGLFDDALGESDKDMRIMEDLIGARLSYINLHVSTLELNLLQDQCNTVLAAVENLPQMIALSERILNDGEPLENVHSSVNSLALEYLPYL